LTSLTESKQILKFTCTEHVSMTVRSEPVSQTGQVSFVAIIVQNFSESYLLRAFLYLPMGPRPMGPEPMSSRRMGPRPTGTGHGPTRAGPMHPEPKGHRTPMGPRSTGPRPMCSRPLWDARNASNSQNRPTPRRNSQAS